MELQWQVERLQADYADAVDAGKLADWPGFFASVCEYKLISRDNYERGLPAALVFCDSPGMLQDRARTWGELNVFAPRNWRHLLGRATLTSVEETSITAEANFVVVETLLGAPSHILCAGRYLDVLVLEDGWKFRRRHCVYDNVLISGSVVFPV